MPNPKALSSPVVTDDLRRATALAVPDDVVRELSRISRWRGAFYLGADWAIIVAVIAACMAWPNPAMVLLTLVVVGSRQHALLAQMHDAAHGRVFSSRRLNDVIAELLMAWPCFVTMRGFRGFHLAHHRMLGTVSDPEFGFRMKNRDVFRDGRRLSLALLRYLSGLGIPLQFIELQRFSEFGPWWSEKQSVRVRMKWFGVRMTYYVAIGGALVWLDLLPALGIWLGAYVTWLAFTLVVRGIVEHGTDTHGQFAGATRTVLANPLEGFLITPHHINLHFAHHWSPAVPFYRLPELHARLFASPPVRERGICYPSYKAAISDCVARASRVDASLLRRGTRWNSDWLSAGPEPAMTGNQIVVLLDEHHPRPQEWADLLNKLHASWLLPSVLGVLPVSESEAARIAGDRGYGFPVACMSPDLMPRFTAYLPTVILIRKGVIASAWIAHLPMVELRAALAD